MKQQKRADRISHQAIYQFTPVPCLGKEKKISARAQQETHPQSPSKLPL
jgi:hypothetical protein